MSNETLCSEQLELLYKMAKKINKEASNEELFTIMKELFNLETMEEKVNLLNNDQINNLLKRYYGRFRKKY